MAYNEHAAYFEAFSQTTAERCKGASCGGWQLSDVDVWVPCSLHPGRPHPESEDNDVLEVPTHAVKVNIGVKSMALRIFYSFKNASEFAKKVAPTFKGVKVVRLVTVQDVQNAEFDVEKIEDWSSDGDIT